MSDFEPSDSESDYDEREKALLQNVRKNYQESSDESQEEVYNVGASEESDQDDIVLADSDVEEQDDDDIPNEKAWGKDKRKYYSTDYVDPDYGGFNEKDIQLAEFEEEEARKLQMKLAEQLDDDDFGLDFLKEESSKNDTVVSEVVKTDLTKLSKLEKIQFLKKESPELFSLMDDFKGKINLYKTLLLPVITKYRKGQIANCSAMDFVQIFTDLILNYCVNVYMYVLLKSTKTSITHHPVVKRLYQYRQMLGKLYPLFEETIKAQIETLLEEKESSEEIKEKKKKKLRFLENLVSTEPTTKKKKKGNIKIAEIKKIEMTDDAMEEDENSQSEIGQIEEINETKENNKLEKRGITYQIAKNKGLTPHRKKEQRNPRVKHRNKFRKAKVRRKGAVREVRNELRRYGGEISGIKATVTKSIKLKS